MWRWSCIKGCSSMTIGSDMMSGTIKWFMPARIVFLSFKDMIDSELFLCIMMPGATPDAVHIQIPGLMFTAESSLHHFKVHFSSNFKSTGGVSPSPRSWWMYTSMPLSTAARTTAGTLSTFVWILDTSILSVFAASRPNFACNLLKLTTDPQ